MNSNEVRQAFISYFESKGHHLVPSAPMVIKNDPSLMFTNAGMNQFKDIFLGNKEPLSPRVVNSQKCLRVSGKHNDLEEVGHDTYHHTMFEMLGNWSFGDYFKKEAIDMAWEFLTVKLKIDPSRLYASIFEGDKVDKTEMDLESLEFWRKHLPAERILKASKKDNFWEMGDTGPCGPCSEIHVDLRSDEERKAVDGKELVNKDNPLVIEIWNLVFIQYNRKANGSLENLPQKHVDTGMGFERLCMVVQGKLSNYDTDIFRRIISKIEEHSNIKYGLKQDSDIAMRVIADHLRAISFSIADGQLPSNTKAGYVIRRILRRAVRYAYTFLNQDEPLLYKLVPELVAIMGESYPEIVSQENLIVKVIHEEEHSFLRTLEKGIGLLDEIVKKTVEAKQKTISGKTVFELYDTYGFPPDLTQLIVKEHNLEIDTPGFDKEMLKQKSRSREDAVKEAGDWTVLHSSQEHEFVGYDQLSAEIKINRYRKVKLKGNVFFQLIFDKTPFYAESGGQVGDKGYIESNNERVEIIDTIKENDLTIHLSKKLPSVPDITFNAVVNSGQRISTAANHSATHLLHYALRAVLGPHVEQKGSLVHPDHLRFDFAHFQKLSAEEIVAIENMVNNKIRENIRLDDLRRVPIEEARSMGAMALFGEKYGNEVRVIRFNDSIELCGGTHVSATGQIGFFKIIKEGAIAAGIRRIEAITGEKCQEYILKMNQTIQSLQQLFPGGKEITTSVEGLISANADLSKKLEKIEAEKLNSLKNELTNKIETLGAIKFLGEVVQVTKADDLKELSFKLKNSAEDLFIILGAEIDAKAHLCIHLSDSLVKEKQLNAAQLIRDFAKEIRGGGGGQAFLASAGGSYPEGLQTAIDKAREWVMNNG